MTSGIRRPERPGAQARDVGAQHLHRVGGRRRPGHRTSSMRSVETTSLRCSSSSASSARCCGLPRSSSRRRAMPPPVPAARTCRLTAARRAGRRRSWSAAPPRARRAVASAKSGAAQISSVRPSSPPSMQAKQSRPVGRGDLVDDLAAGRQPHAAGADLVGRPDVALGVERAAVRPEPQLRERLRERRELGRRARPAPRRGGR